jgi:hypothetical protein
MERLGVALQGWIEPSQAALAASGQDNPLPPDSDGLRLLGPQVVNNLTDPVVGGLAGLLDLNPDHASNFEPAFLEALKTTKPGDYLWAISYVRDSGWDTAIAQEYLKNWVSWSTASLPGSYFVASE